MRVSRAAVLIGIDDYEDNDKLLRAAGADASRMSEVLSKNHDGSANFKCSLLTNREQKPIKRAHILRNAERLLLQSSVDVALFYFAGHGGQDRTGGFLAAQDTRSRHSGVRMAELLAMANASTIPQVIFLIDSCSSNAMGAPGNQAVLREGLSIMTAAHEGQLAQADGGGGLFTTALLGALEGGAADVRGQVTLAGIHAYVDQSFGAFRQRPEFKAHVSRLTVLRRCKAAVKDKILRRFPKWFPAGSPHYPLDPSYDTGGENEKIMRQFRKCRNAKLLEPVPPHDDLYPAAMASGACRLTPLGRLYRRMAAAGEL